jgi:hypothetical protein
MKFVVGQAVLLLAAVLILCALDGCAGQGLSLAGAAGPRSGLSAPVMLGSGAKTASGAPVGIWITWTRSASPLAQGYYLYRDTDSIPDPPIGSGIDPSLRVNGGAMIAQPGSGASVTFNDMFACVVGETYYYRVTLVDNLDQESDPSNEITWTVQGQTVGGINPASAYWGDSITLSGNTFGAYNAATDFVRFPAIGGGEVDGIIELPADWTDTSIKVTVPDNALTGPVQVVIDATIAESDTDLTVLNAWIGAVAPNPGFVQQELIISGGNYGAVRGASTVVIGAKDVSSAVTAWSASTIKLIPPADTVAGDVRVSVNAHASNLVAWAPRPEIQSVTPLSAQAGEDVVLNGRLFEAAAGQVLLDGNAAQTIVDWAAGQITFTLAGSSGVHTLSVQAAGGGTSNNVTFTIAPPLAVTMGGLTAGVVYRPASPPDISITTAPDADSVELLIDGDVRGTLTSPYSSVSLPVDYMTNGTHQVKLVAYRRAVVAESAPVDVIVYSLEGDVDGNGRVGISDLVALEGYIGLTQADPGFWPWYDTDGDGVVTEADLSLIGYNFTLSIFPVPPP